MREPAQNSNSCSRDDRTAVASAFFLTTLGCKVNQYESQALREAWIALGLTETKDPGRASVLVVNSCAVTARAMADVRSAVRRLHRASPAAAILVTGCAAEVAEKELLALPGVRRVVGQSEKAELLRSLFPAPLPDAAPEPSPAPRPPEKAGWPAAPEPFPPFAVSGYDRTRAVLKIQDGCSRGCAYCIVPLTRKEPRSRPFSASLAEARRLLDAGFREIVISGVNLGQFRLPETQRPGRAASGSFWSFLARLDAALAPQWAGRARLRVSSLDPGQLGPEALDVLASCRLFCPHLHLSLQSGSPAVLRRMGREGRELAVIPEFLDDFRKIHPVFGLGADILTAFPGESESEFSEGLAFFTRLPLSYAHVFPYSSRPGTRAAALPGQLPAQAKKERAAVLRDLVRSKKRSFLHALLALPQVTVAFEGSSVQGDADGVECGAENRAEDREEGGAAKGLSGKSEFYADCLLARQGFSGTGAGHPFAREGARELTPARPIGVERDLLLVAVGERREQGEKA